MSQRAGDVREPSGEPLVRTLERALTATAPPIALGELAPSVATSQLARWAVALWTAGDQAARGSVLVGRARFASRRLGPTDTAAVIAFAGVVVMTGAAVHLALLAFAQPYPFPSHAAWVLPALAGATALGAVAGRSALARAWADRVARRREFLE